MNVRQSCLLFFAMCASHGAVPAQVTKLQPFSITISTPAEVVKPGSEVRLDISLKNLLDKTILLPKNVGQEETDADYVIEVRDSTGRSATETQRGQMIRGKGTKRYFGSIRWVGAKPGETLKESVALNKDFDLNKPGKYVIQIQRYVPDDLGGGGVKSNVISVSVNPE